MCRDEARILECASVDEFPEHFTGWFASKPAWMIKAWKAIIDTNGHYARPDLVGLSVTNHRPSQHPVVLRTQPKPALLAEAAERNGVEPALVESVMHEAARLDAPVNR